MASKPYLACPACGCTDIQVSAWINANTGAVITCARSVDYFYCPQCDYMGLDATFKQAESVRRLRPFVSGNVAKGRDSE